MPQADMPRNRCAVNVNLALMRLHRRAREVEALRQELQECETSYYHAIADHLAPWVSSIPASPAPTRDHDATPEAVGAHLVHMQEMMRHMYVSLARHYHPDHQGQQSTRMMQKINDAYAEQEMGTLMVLYQDTLPLTSSISISDEDMHHYLERIHLLCAQLEEEYQQLLQSDRYALKERLLRARLEGNNLIAQVAQSLKQHYV